MTVVVRCNLGWGELARGGLKCGWKELGFRLTPRPSLLFTVEVDYELHIKNGAFSLADLPVLAIYTTDATTSSGNTEEGEEAIVVLRDEPVARSRADVGNYLVGSTTAAATIEDDKGHLIHTLQAAGLHKLEHGQAERPPRSVSHVLHVLENLPDEASHGGDGTFSVRARSIPPASLFSRGRIAVNYNHTTPRPVRRKSASELEDAAEAAHAAAKAAGRRLSDENVATESICESQCDSSWNFFYKNWLTSSYFMVCYTTNYSEANVWQQCSASLSFPLTIFSSTRTYGSISPFIRTRRQTTAESMRPNAHFAWRVSSGARNPTRSNSTITLRPRALSPRSMRLSVGTTLKRKVKLSVRIAGPI
mmetsp:Transcript_57910/g.159909  ORF Transcript_57910/g.159909 Transcript_57910/m.159909 type:complete len:363 (-) Transcript_57910:134-1222(-)